MNSLIKAETVKNTFIMVAIDRTKKDRHWSIVLYELETDYNIASKLTNILYVTDQLQTWTVLKWSSRFKMGQTVLKWAIPFPDLRLF